MLALIATQVTGARGYVPVDKEERAEAQVSRPAAGQSPGGAEEEEGNVLSNARR